MNLHSITSGIRGLFYRDESNLVLTLFWNTLYIAFFLLPLGINIPTPFFIVAIIFGVLNVFKTFHLFTMNNKVLFLFPLYFLTLCVSLIFTNNKDEGVFLIQRSLTLVFFPMIFMFVKEDASSVRKLFDFLLYGILISFFIQFFRAFFYFIQDTKIDLISDYTFGGIISFTNSLFSKFHYQLRVEYSGIVNSNYVSLYILLVLCYYLKRKLTSRYQLCILLVLFLYIFILASPAAYITLSFMAFLLLITIKDRSKKYLMFIIYLLGILIFFGSISDNKTITNEPKVQKAGVEKSRWQIWHTSMLLIYESPVFGYGVGDANEALFQKYKVLGYMDTYQHKFNAHNQFFQTALQTGILGLAVLVSIFVTLAIRLKRSRNEFLVFLIFFISLFFESMLVRFNGIVFFSVIIPLLLKERSILSSRIIRNNSLLITKKQD